MGLHVASGLSSKRSSIASITSLSSSRKSSLSTTPDDSQEGRIASVVAHFSDPDLVIASSEADATLDKGYLRGWAGGFGGGQGRKSALTEGERFWLVSTAGNMELFGSNRCFCLPLRRDSASIGRLRRGWLRALLSLTIPFFIRYLDATKGDVPQAIQRLKDTLIWRRSFGINELFDDPDVEEEVCR